MNAPLLVDLPALGFSRHDRVVKVDHSRIQRKIGRINEAAAVGSGIPANGATADCQGTGKRIIVNGAPAVRRAVAAESAVGDGRVADVVEATPPARAAGGLVVA